ncbi:MAG: GntR family transcriptional regulator [Deltaproteobacteria bacterium]|nr:GntR family transcriptional regulator [Deltaproteobacteria bacterium]
MSPEQPIARQALYQEVAERLRRLIYRGDLPAGAWVDEQALATRFGTSRTPLREALKVLHAEGLVRLDPRRGSFVAGELTSGDLDDLFPVMALLEGRCAYEAVRKASPADVARLEAIHARLEELAAAGDVDGYYESNYVFHETIQELARNPWLSRIVSELRRFLRLLRGRQLRVPGRLQASLAEHRRVMRALRRGDAGAAEKVMRAHLLSQRAALAVQEAARAPRKRRRRRGS